MNTTAHHWLQTIRGYQVGNLPRALLYFKPSSFTETELAMVVECCKEREAALQQFDTELRRAVKALRTAQMEILKDRNRRKAEKAREDHARKLKAEQDAELLNSWVNHVNKGGPRVRPGGDGYLPILDKAKETISVQELLNQSPQQAYTDGKGPLTEKDLVPGALLTTKPKDGVLSRSPVVPLITVADRMLVGGPGAWTIVGSDLVTRYNLAGKATAKVLEVLNANYWKATRPGQFVSAMSVNVRRP